LLYCHNNKPAGQRRLTGLLARSTLPNDLYGIEIADYATYATGSYYL